MSAISYLHSASHSGSHPLSHWRGDARPGTASGRTFCRGEDLPSILRRERARADRIGGGFCVVLYGLRGEREETAAVARLGEAVAGRARETDEVCLFGGRFVCAVLPDTPAAGGRRFAEAVRASLNGQADRATFEVLSYPSTSPGQAGVDGAADRRPAAGAPAADERRPAHGDDVATALTYTVNRDGGAETAPLLSAFLRHVGSSASFPREDGASATIDAVFAAPLPLWKRAIDVVTAGLALLCLSPVLAVVAAAIRIACGRPVIFKQRRAGLLGRPFEIYKFRTMAVDAERRQNELRQRSEQDGPAFKMTNDPRVTRLGRFLRKTSLDELPQLWNVLKGDMSLVGPRPLPCNEASACSQWQRRRLDVTPGITCIWQVKGRSRVSFPEWMRMDISYVRSRRLLRDVSLLLLTVPAVLLRRGAK